MNQLIRHTIRSVSLILTVLAALTLAACGNGGGSSSGGGGGGGGGLATGGFTKSFGVIISGGDSLPFHDTFDVKIQYLYTASEINGSGNITTLRFNRPSETTSEKTCQNMTVKLGHTSLPALTSTFINNVQQGKGTQVTVLNNTTVTIPVGAAGTWFDVALTTPFYYNGTDNLVVELERTTACSASQLATTTLAATNRRAASLASDVTPGVADHNQTTSDPPSTPQIWMQFVFAGGDNQVLALDSTSDNGSNAMAPGSTGRTQALILASHIDGSGPITGIAFLAETTTAATEAVVTIRMVHIDPATTDLTSDFDNNFGGATPITVTQDVNVSIGDGATKFWIPLTGTFNYDGASNLLLDITMTVNIGGFRVGYQNVPNDRVVTWTDPASVTGSRRSRAFQPVLRFNGALIQVMPKGNSGSTQVLGGWSGTGAGQTQNLYPPSIVGTGGAVTSISVRLNANSVAATIPNYKIYMGNTAKTTFNTADTYSSNMEINPTLVFDGSFDIPAGLKQGDWVTIPLQNNFTYDPTRNMSILFMADSASPGNNRVSASFDATMFPTHEVGRNNNTVDITGTPDWSWSGIVDVRLNIAK